MNYEDKKRELADNGVTMRFFYVAIELFHVTPWELAERVTQDQIEWLIAYTEVKAEKESAALEKARHKSNRN